MRRPVALAAAPVKLRLSLASFTVSPMRFTVTSWWSVAVGVPLKSKVRVRPAAEAGGAVSSVVGSLS